VPAQGVNTGVFSSAGGKVAGVFATGLALAATVAHFYLNKSAPDATGPLAVMDHVFDLVVALALGFILLAAGYTLIKLFSLQFASSAEKLTFSFFLGAGAVALSIAIIGLLGLFRVWSVLTLLLAWLLIAARDIPDVYRRFTQTIKTAMTTPGMVVPAMLFSGLIGIVTLRTLIPPYIPDECIYHLPVPQQFIQQGRIFPSYNNLFGNLPFLIHMLYVPCLMVGSDIAAKFISFFLAITTAVSLYAFCARFLMRRIGLVALFAFFAAGVVVEVAITTRIDVSLAGMLFACTYAMINYLATRSRGWLWLSALFAGFSLGIKHTAALWIFLVGVLYLVETMRNRELIPKILQSGVIYTLLALAVASPWYIKNAVWFHNPVYPFVTGEVAEFGPNEIRFFDAEIERKLDAHFNATRSAIPEVVAAQERALAAAARERLVRHPLRLWEFFTKPSDYLMAEPFQFPNYLFLLIPLIVFLRPTRWVMWLLVISVTFVFGVTATSWIARYLLPAYPALTVVAAFTLTNLATRLQPKFSYARLLPIYALLAAFATILAPSIASMRELQSLQFLTGKISRNQFLTRFTYYRPLAFINVQLPENARVMMIGAQMNYGLERFYYSDESWFATKWRRLLAHNDSLEGVNQDLKRQGFSHILYNPGLFLFAANMGVEGTGGMSLIAEPVNGAAAQGPEYPLLRNWSTFTLYKEKYLESIYKGEDGYEILRIK
jgi:4-amino-4-deoxy-L-arabinose transferase-like glycosyltransferase